jgi:cytochrome c oxidase subunit III
MMAHNPENEMNRFKNSVAMTVTLISFGMMFASLFLGYFLVRFNAPTWPPVEIENMPQLLPFMSTLVMGLSSLSYYKMEFSASHRKGFWLLTVALGFLFLGFQFVLWNALAASGILVSNGNVPSMVYAFTWLHAAHIVIALLLVLWLGFYIFRRPEGLTEAKLINVGKFWHFLGVIWLMMYLMLFVL